MLDSMRRNANSWVFSLVFAVIIFVFAINFGPWAGRISADTPTYAVQVNGRIIGVSEYQSAMGRMRERFSGMTDEQVEKLGLSSRIVDGLIERELLAQLAESNNLVVTDKDLVAQIKKNLFAGQEELMNPETYERIIESNFQMTAGEFDELQRREILASRMAKILKTSVHVTDSDLKSVFATENDLVSVNYIRINPTFFTEATLPSEPEMNKWATENEEKLKTYYEKNLAQFVSAEQPAVQKKFVDVRSEIAKKLWLSNHQLDKAKKYAQEILAELKAGKKLDKISPKGLVRTAEGSKPVLTETAPVFASTSLFSKTGVLAQGITREVAAAAYGLSSEKAYVEEPVLSRDNLYIVELKERKMPDDAQFEKEKEALRKKLTENRANEFLRGYIDVMKKSAKIVKNPSLFDPQQEEA